MDHKIAFTSDGSEQNPGSGPGERRGNGQLTPEQANHLQRFSVQCPNPSDGQECQTTTGVCLEHKHIPNRRNLTTAQNNHAEVASLNENIRIREENSSLLETLRYAKCSSCGNLSHLGEGQDSGIALLLRENVQLKQECERVANEIIIYLAEVAYSANNNGSVSGAVSSSVDPCSGNIRVPRLPQNLTRIPELESVLIPYLARGCMDELARLLFEDELFWTKSKAEDKYNLHWENYECHFPLAEYYRRSKKHNESSKASGLVPMSGKSLVDILLDTDKRAVFFPNLISESRTVEMLACGDLSRNGALQLVYERMHVLSPLIQPREFYVLRCCQQTDVGRWVIADITCEFDTSKPRVSPSRHVRHPSGCMIQDLSNGFSEVIWVEHVSIDAPNEVPRLFGDIVLSGLAFGAQRWLNTLQRMGERYSYLFEDRVLPLEFEHENVAPWVQFTRVGITKLSMANVKRFCSRLSMCGKLNRPQPTVINRGDIQIAIFKNTGPESAGHIISAAKSLWLPFVPRAVFDFLCDTQKRHKWDILCSKGARRITKIPTGRLLENNISIIMPFSHVRRLIVQESSIDAMGALIVYGQTNCQGSGTLCTPLKDSGMSPLPSGFTICPYGDHNQSGPSTSSSSGSRPGGCVMTVLFNFHTRDSLPIGSDRLEPVSAILNFSVESIEREVYSL